MNWIRTIYQESVALAEKRSKQLQFVGLIFLFVALMFYRWYDFTPSFYWHLGGLSALTLGLLLLPQLVYPVLIFWFLIGKFFGEIVSSILLSVLYFLFIWIGKLFVKVDLTPGWKERKDSTDYSSMG